MKILNPFFLALTLLPYNLHSEELTSEFKESLVWGNGEVSLPTNFSVGRSEGDLVIRPKQLKISSNQIEKIDSDNLIPASNLEISYSRYLQEVRWRYPFLESCHIFNTPDLQRIKFSKKGAASLVTLSVAGCFSLLGITPETAKESPNAIFGNFENLTHLHLRTLPKIEVLGDATEGFPSLIHLQVKDCCNIHTIYPDSFPNLEKLNFSIRYLSLIENKDEVIENLQKLDSSLAKLIEKNRDNFTAPIELGEIVYFNKAKNLGMESVALAEEVNEFLRKE